MKGLLKMSSRQNAVIPAKQPAKRKRGGHELGAIKAHQRSAKRYEALA
jgi:hypothetical protein